MKRSIAPNKEALWTRRSMLMALAGAGLTVPACEFSQLFSWNDGNPVIFGYGTAPNYDKRFKTLRLKIFKDSTFWSALPVPGLEMELTEILMQQIEQKTPYRIDNGDADTELSGIILSFIKSTLNYDQQNEEREVQTTMVCAVKWQDLRTGQMLSGPAQRVVESPVPSGLLPGQADPLNSTAGPGTMLQMPITAAPIGPGNNQATMTNTPPAPNAGNPSLGQSSAPGSPNGPPVLGTGLTVPTGGVLVSSTGYYRPELGESLATAELANCNMMAQQIISMMEKGW